MAKSKEKLTPIPRGRKVQAPAPAANATAAPDPARIAETRIVPTADLAFLVENPMDHSDQEVAAMRESLRRFGQVGALVVNRRHSPPVVQGGNKRLRAMLAEGWQTCAVMEGDWSDEEAAALVLVLNATQTTTYVPAHLQAAMQRMKGVNLGENMDGVFARLAEAQKLIPKTESQPPAREGGGGSEKRKITCPECQHEFEP